VHTADFAVVTVIVPCRNEERFIGQCLDAIVWNDYPKDRLEVLVVDGMSQDRTREIVADYERRHTFIRLLENPKKSIPAAMNIGVRHAKGETIIKMDAHSTCQPDHISACVQYQREYRAENVGGVCRILPGARSTVARAIALGLAHPFGSGNALIKVGADKPAWADTAAFGCYRREVFDRIGLFNEKLLGSSDMDVNVRIRAAGGGILLVPEIVIDYSADATLRAFWKHNFADGVWATYVLKFRSKAWSWRHWVPLAFVSGLLGCLLLSAVSAYFFYLFCLMAGGYLLASIGASAQVSVRKRTPKYMLALPVVFAIRHVAHGVGALFGLALVLLPGEHWKGRRGVARHETPIDQAML
jgi:glycosyltransferase involved in cell wall biosynthesis